MRLGISGYDRTYHGALLDAQILADTYLNLTGGQVTFDLTESQIEESKDEIDNKSEDVNFLKFNAKPVFQSVTKELKLPKLIWPVCKTTATVIEIKKLEATFLIKWYIAVPSPK